MKLSSVVNRINGNVDRFTTDLMYYIGGEHFESNELAITKKGLLKENLNILGFKFHFAFQERDVIFMARNPHLRKAGMVMFSGLCSDASYILRSKDENVLTQEFLAVQLQSDHFWDYCESHKVGSVNFANNWSSIANYEFDLPPIEVQRKIGEKVWAAYRVKESYKKLLAATDDMLKAKFMEMFGGQGVVTLSEACDIVMGTSPDSQYYNTNCEGLPFYQGKTEFTDMYIGGAEVWCTKPIRVAEKNEILMSVRAPVGAINIAAEKCCIGRGLCSIKPKDNVTKLLFVFYALKLQEEEISRLGTGSTFKAVNKDQVYNKITLPLPPLPLQQQFVEIATQAEATKESLRKSIENIDQVIKSLINQ